MSAPDKQLARRIAALRRFAAAITVLNLFGHLVLGFEQSWAQPFVGLAAAYGTELVLELVNAAQQNRRARFLGGFSRFVDYFLPAHITGLACSMLLYSNDCLGPVAFASSAAIVSKWWFRVRVGQHERHFLNPSNVGITLTLLLFPWVGIAQPYQYTENVHGAWYWIIPCIFITLGSMLNARYTSRMPLIAAWLLTFAAQALARALLFQTPLFVGLLPMTGVAFLLFTFYMVTDPGTTPSDTGCQVAFGAAVALVYAALMMVHVPFTLFFALTIVCVSRGLSLVLWSAAPQSARARVGALAHTMLAGSRS